MQKDSFVTLREIALSHSAKYFDSGTFQTDLARLVAFPSESQNPRAERHLRSYLEAGVGPILAALGFQARLMPNPVVGDGPMLLAERIEGDGLPTILTYGHGDVVRGQQGSGTTGWSLSPFGLKTTATMAVAQRTTRVSTLSISKPSDRYCMRGAGLASTSKYCSRPAKK